jgi:isopenicillin N synthase-like dioxygenase
LLIYRPGPEGTVTTSKHTDATWLTLLVQDSTGGLHVRRNDRTAEWQAVAPLEGAVLVNTGNVLEQETRSAPGVSFFPSVCHYVKRVKGAASATRISLPFFYDREGGRTGGCK